MCVICVSEKGVKQPTKETLATCFRNNPHGAGYMLARNGKVFIHKGFMDFEDFWRAIRSEHLTAADPVVYHFRISTQAGVKPEMTHPFPLSDQLKHMKALDLVCEMGVAHNGIIRLTSGKNDEYNDTALYIARYLTKLVRRAEDLVDLDVDTLIEATTSGSRLAILHATGFVSLYGPGWVRDDKGLRYSNHSFENRVYVRPAPTAFSLI